MLHVDSLHISGDWAAWVQAGVGVEALLAETQRRFDREGLRLLTVEVDTTGGEFRWVAVFRSGDWAHRLTVNRDQATFLRETQEFFDREGLRLEHATTYILGGRRLWAGSYRSARWAHRFTIGRDTATFARETQDWFDRERLRITQAIPYQDGGALRWAGIYTSGDWTVRHAFGRDRRTFLSETQQWFDREGLRLQHMARYLDAGQERWVGIYRSAGWAHRTMLDRPMPHFLGATQQLFDQSGLRCAHASLREQPSQLIRLHAKVLETPTISVAQMLRNMQETYEPHGFTVELVSTETLNLPLLTDLDAGACRGTPSAEQIQLFANRNSAGPLDLVIYFCRTVVRTTDMAALNGCATHPVGQPGAAVARNASPWTLAHEVGHVLDLDHCDTPAMPLFDRLMTGNSTNNITNPPPDLVATEVTTMVNSPFTNVA